MEYKITGCKPEKLFHFFEDISAIPRGSGNEKGLSDYLVKFAKDRNLWVYQDESNNVIIQGRKLRPRRREAAYYIPYCNSGCNAGNTCRYYSCNRKSGK